MKFQVIITSVKSDLTDQVVDGAKEAGATGATIIPGRGTGLKEAKSFFGLSLESQTDIIMLLVEEHILDNVMEAIKIAGRFEEPGTGIAFALPVSKVVGLESQIESFKDNARKKYF